MKVGETHASQSSSSSPQEIENILEGHFFFFFIVKIHTPGPNTITLSMKKALHPLPQLAPVLYDFSALGCFSISLFTSLADPLPGDLTSFPPSEKIATASSAAWV